MLPPTRTFQCPNCGAQLHPEAGDETVRCEFCGATSPLTTAVEPPVLATPPAGEAPSAAGGGWLRRGAFLAVVALAVLGIALGVRLGGKKGDAPPMAASPAPPVVARDAGAPVRVATEWRSSPIVLDVNGDGVEDIVGQWEPDHHCTTGVIDGRTRRVLWSVVHDQNCGWPQPFTVASSVLVLSPSQSPSVELYALPDGTDLGRVDLDRPASRLLGHGHEAWVNMAGPEAIIDTTTKTVKSQPLSRRPAWVPFVLGKLLPAGHYEPQVRCTPSPCPDANLQRPVPLAPNMMPWQVLLDDGDDTAIAVGTTLRGTKLPMVAGFSVKSQAIAWTHTFGTPETAREGAASAVLAQRTLYIQYATKDPANPDSYQRSRLAALASTTGEQLWDVALDDDRGDAQIVAGAYVYVPLAHALELRDPKTGALVSLLP